MSRVILESTDPTIESVVVGIDPPLGCWFAQVYNAAPTSEENELRIWKDIASQSEVIEVIKKYADLKCPRTQKVLEYVVMDLDPQIAIDKGC